MRTERLHIGWFFVPVHAFQFRLSGGRAAGRLERTGILILLTKGRKRGEPRPSPLLCFQFGESGDLIVVASNDGRDLHPARHLNIAADPNVTAGTSRERLATKVHVIRGDETAALYDMGITANPRFATCRVGPRREIPVVARRRARPSVREAAVTSGRTHGSA